MDAWGEADPKRKAEEEEQISLLVGESALPGARRLRLRLLNATLLSSRNSPHTRIIVARLSRRRYRLNYKYVIELFIPRVGFVISLICVYVNQVYL